MSLGSLIEFEIDRFRRKDLENAGWITVDVDQRSRTLVARSSILQLFSTMSYGINPDGMARHTVGNCTFSEPQGRNKLGCGVELTLLLPDGAPDLVADRARGVITRLARLNLNPVSAIEAVVKSAASRTQTSLKDETIYEFDNVVMPRFKNEIVGAFIEIGLKANASIQWEGYTDSSEPYVMDDVVIPFRIPGVARRLETTLSCEIIADREKKAVIACLQPNKAIVARAAKEAIASYFDDEALFSKLLGDHRAIERACEAEINIKLKPYAHRVRGFAIMKPKGLPDLPPSQIQVDVETPIQLTDSDTPVPLKHTAQLALSDRSRFIIKSLNQAIDPKEYAVLAIKNAAAKLLQGKTFVDLVQAFVLDPLNVQRSQIKPKLELGEQFSGEIKSSLKDIGYDIHHIATTPKAKLVELLIHSPYITLAKHDYQLKGGTPVIVEITFNGNLASLDAIRGRMTLETDPAADMQADLPSVVQSVLGDVTPFHYDAGTPLGDSGENWNDRLRERIKQRLNDAYGFTIHNLQINALESQARAYLRTLQAGGGHTFTIENYSPGRDGQSRGLRLRITYSIREPRIIEGNRLNPFQVYERYIEAALYTLTPERAHESIKEAIAGELNEVFNRLNREAIQHVLLEGKFGDKQERRREYDALVSRAKNFVANNFGLLIDLSVSVDSDDPRGVTDILLENDATELQARLQIESKLRISKADAARRAWDRYHDALMKYDPQSADEEERNGLGELKRQAQQLEQEAEIGKRPHIADQLRGSVSRPEPLEPSQVLGLEKEQKLDHKDGVDQDKVIDMKTQEL
jgi:hypothetical protein